MKKGDLIISQITKTKYHNPDYFLMKLKNLMKTDQSFPQAGGFDIFGAVSTIYCCFSHLPGSNQLKLCPNVDPKTVPPVYHNEEMRK